MNVMRRLYFILRRLPLVGSLHLCSASDHGEATKELLISMLISMSPVYIGALALYIVQSGSATYRYIDCAKDIVQNGELFIYAAAVLAPVVYIVSRDRHNGRSFPSKFTFIGITIVVALISTCIFTIARVKAQVLPANILAMSLIVFLVAVIVFYFALVYNNKLLPPDPAEKMRDNDRNFTERLRNHRLNQKEEN